MLTDGGVAALADSAASALRRWVEPRNWVGFDPYDLRAHPVYLWASRTNGRLRIPARALRGAFALVETYCPEAARKLLRIEGALNPKGIALFARAYLTLFALKRDPALAELAEHCLKLLRDTVAPGHCGAGWGYPFNWQSRNFIPANTPNAVVTHAAGDAFWRAYRLWGKEEHLETCSGICRFFLTGLNRHISESGGQCFSYTPVDRMRVLNVSLFVSEFLIRIGVHIGNSDFVAEGMRGVDYVLNNQNPDGSWYYFAAEEGLRNSIDHYHTGFVLRSLRSVAAVTADTRVSEALTRGFAFYWMHLFTPDHLPKMTAEHLFPVNIHSVAEALIALSEFRRMDSFVARYPIAARLTTLLEWTDSNMRDSAGFYYFSKTRRRTARIPFMRWGQAWMLVALSEVLAGHNSHSPASDSL